MRRKKRDRRGKALRSLGLALALYMCFQWAAGYRLLPRWVRGLAQDEWGLGRTQLAASLGRGGLDSRSRFYLASGEGTVLFFAARRTPLLGWSLEGSTSVSRGSGQRTETLMAGGYTLEREETGEQEIWVFGEIRAREVAEIAVYGTATPENWAPVDLLEPTQEEWEQLEPRELARLGAEDWRWSQNRKFFAWNSMYTDGWEKPRNWWWTYIESYDAAGALLERIYVGDVWSGGRI